MAIVPNILTTGPFKILTIWNPDVFAQISNVFFTKWWLLFQILWSGRVQNKKNNLRWNKQILILLFEISDFKSHSNKKPFATPEKMCVYKHSIQLHKLYNSTNQSIEWLHLNTQQNFNSRVTNNFCNPSNIISIMSIY